jgi:D-glycero-D-manno-heptose 1,7-bisphosphate phosphatase
LRPGVFLDRDGVLNVAEERNGCRHPPSGPDDVKLLPGVIEACQRLRNEGLVLVVVTNQPDVARGTQKLPVVNAINERLQSRLRLDEVVVCPHDDKDGCACRKPKPGMILAAADRLGLDLGASTMVGDRWRDIEAGRAAGVATVFVDRGYHEQQPAQPDHVAAELIDAVPFILGRAQARGEALP